MGGGNGIWITPGFPVANLKIRQWFYTVGEMGVTVKTATLEFVTLCNLPYHLIHYIIKKVLIFEAIWFNVRSTRHILFKVKFNLRTENKNTHWVTVTLIYMFVTNNRITIVLLCNHRFRHHKSNLTYLPQIFNWLMMELADYLVKYASRSKWFVFFGLICINYEPFPSIKESDGPENQHREVVFGWYYARFFCWFMLLLSAYYDIRWTVFRFNSATLRTSTSLPLDTENIWAHLLAYQSWSKYQGLKIQGWCHLTSKNTGVSSPITYPQIFTYVGAAYCGQ